MANETSVEGEGGSHHHRRHQLPTSSSSSSNAQRKSCFSKCKTPALLRCSAPQWLEKAIIGITTPLLTWAVTFLLVGDEALPGGQIFAILIVLFLGLFIGFFLEKISVPPLLGMLAVGIAVRNVPGFQFGEDLEEHVTSPLRRIALVVILIRAGLGLDPVVLKKLSMVVIRLAFGPCFMEAMTLGITAHFILGYPWAWGMMLGFVVAAVSPAVIVPCLLNLGGRGFGVAKGIPTIVIAAASIDDILAISGFAMCVGFALTNQGTSLVMTIFKGPIELTMGVLFGIVYGLTMGILIDRSDEEMKGATIFRVIFLLAGGCFSLFGFQYVNFSGSGALGCLVSAFVAAIIWRKKEIIQDNDGLNRTFQLLWYVFQPLLFGLIGCEIDLATMHTDVILNGLICLGIALCIRILTSFFMVAGAGLTIKERLFVAVAWLPKATVQAAIGPMALDLARSQNAGPAAEKMGLEILTIAVISILLTAPVGAIAVMITGPKLLSKDSVQDGSVDLKTLKSAAALPGPTAKSSGRTNVTGVSGDSQDTTIRPGGENPIKINIDVVMASSIKITSKENLHNRK